LKGNSSWRLFVKIGLTEKNNMITIAFVDKTLKEPFIFANEKDGFSSKL